MTWIFVVVVFLIFISVKKMQKLYSVVENDCIEEETKPKKCINVQDITQDSQSLPKYENFSLKFSHHSFRFI